MKKVIFLIEKSNELKYLSSTLFFFNKKKIEIQICFIQKIEYKNDFKKYLKPENAKGSLLKKIKLKKFNDKSKFHNFCIDERKNIAFIFSLHFISKERFKISEKFLQAITKNGCVFVKG